MNEGKGLSWKIYIRSIETTTDSEATEVNESKSLSDSSDSSSSDLSTSTASSNEKDEEEKPGPAVYTLNLKDVGLWPRNISNDTRIFMVGQGASLVQNLDSDFGEMIGNGPDCTNYIIFKIFHFWSFGHCCRSQDIPWFNVDHKLYDLYQKHACRRSHTTPALTHFYKYCIHSLQKYTTVYIYIYLSVCVHIILTTVKCICVCNIICVYIIKHMYVYI